MEFVPVFSLTDLQPLQPKRDQTRRVVGTKLPPVIDLKSRREEDENSQSLFYQGQKVGN